MFKSLRRLTDLFSACQTGWLSFKSYCYKFVAERKSWQAAKIHCESITPKNKIGDLASIGDDATNMFLSRMTTGKQAWIGGQQDSLGVWSWSDGRYWNFTSWATGRVDTQYSILIKGVYSILYTSASKFCKI